MPTDDPSLDARVQDSLRTCHEALLRRGELLTKERLSECYAIFRDRFGPERLQGLDGETLLNTMHAHGGRDSLVYWLEFKSDDEFPTRRFGSIAGGSALKFGLYKSQETGEWMTGTATKQKTLSVPDAVAMARNHREQLVAAVAAMQSLTAGANDLDYAALQVRLDEVAPAVCRLGWGHKYLSLLFPEKLDDYHNELYQRHHLLKLLDRPPTEAGLYVAAGRFVRVAGLMGWHLNQLTAVLNERNGAPAKYWRIATKVGDEANEVSVWADMQAGGFASIGWPALGDLTAALAGDDPKERISALLQKEYNADPQFVSRKAFALHSFGNVMTENDVLLAADGDRILGVGRVTKGSYRFDTSPPANAPHRRDVEWVSSVEWRLPASEGAQTTFSALRKHEENLLEAERHLLQPSSERVSPPVSTTQERPIRKTVRLEGVIPEKVQAILERKGQAILYGPPGTGKTHWARQTAQDLAAIAAFGCLYCDLEPEQKSAVTGNASEPGLLRCCTFHPAYGYEDFIEGYRPRQGVGGQLIFEPRDGIFKRLCHDAVGAPNRKFILLIDEINRGDIPRIFGELLTLLEKDKRGQQVTLAVSGERFSVPQNVLVIGTMNTADRSIALLDTALRRRFGFVELLPDSATLAGALAGDAIPLARWLDKLNDRIREHVGKDARNLQIGHAYLMEGGGKPVTDFARFTRILAEDIIPLLEEYCYEDYALLTQILGQAMVDESRQRVREELFAPARQQDLIQALLAPTPDLTTSPEAVAQPSPAAEADEEPEDPTK